MNLTQHSSWPPRDRAGAAISINRLSPCPLPFSLRWRRERVSPLGARFRNGSTAERSRSGRAVRPANGFEATARTFRIRVGFHDLFQQVHPLGTVPATQLVQVRQGSRTWLGSFGWKRRVPKGGRRFFLPPSGLFAQRDEAGSNPIIQDPVTKRRSRQAGFPEGVDGQDGKLRTRRNDKDVSNLAGEIKVPSIRNG